MSALTAEKAMHHKMKLDILSLPMQANVKIWRGSLVMMSGIDGFATFGEDNNSGYVIGGVAEESIDNTGGADGERNIRVRRFGAYQFDIANGSESQSLVGGKIHLLSETEVDVQSNLISDILVGYVLSVDVAAKTCFVLIDAFGVTEQ
jgi:hypothetical protein